MDYTTTRFKPKKRALSWILQVPLVLLFISWNDSRCRGNHRILKQHLLYPNVLSTNTGDVQVRTSPFVVSASFLLFHTIGRSRRSDHRTSRSFISSVKYQHLSRSFVHNNNNNIHDNPHLDARAYQIENGVIYQFRGMVETGYGRGGKKLGFPTANLGPATFFDTILTNISTGVYFGYAMIEPPIVSFDVDCDDNNSTTDIPNLHWNHIYKAVVNIGYSPTFVGQENQRKIIEAHLLLPTETTSTVDIDFYHTTLRLQLLGYIRPEMKFTSLPDLIQQINQDIDTTQQLLGLDLYQLTSESLTFFATNANDERQQPPPPPWIGKSGGDAIASYEILPAFTKYDQNIQQVD